MNLPLVPGLIGSLLAIPFKAAANVGLSAVSGWIVAGAQAILAEVVQVIGQVTTPSLSASWFSPSYWHMAGLALLLTVPFLFAAAVQAVIRTDLGVLLRAAFVDLPIAVLAVTITAPLVGLLLAATDEMCSAVTGGQTAGGSFLTATAADLSTLHGGCMLVVIAVVILLAGMVLMVELIMRAAAIYIVVLFLPLGFAAMVWPARRVWVKRMVELLIALILSKFAMVAILSLAVTGLASFGAGTSSLGAGLTAMALMVLAAFSPWTLLRLLPFTEIAAGAASTLAHESRQGVGRIAKSGFNAAAFATEPMAAGAHALQNLVRDSAAADPTQSGGRGPAPLGRRLGSSARLDGDAAPGAGAPGQTDSAPSGAVAGFGAPTGSRAPTGFGAGSDPGAPEDRGGASETTYAAAAVTASADGPPEHSGSTDSRAPARGTNGEVASRTGGGAPHVDLASATGILDGASPSPAEKGPIEALSPVFDRDNRGEMNLHGDRRGWLISPDGEAPGLIREGGHDPDGMSSDDTAGARL